MKSMAVSVDYFEVGRLLWPIFGWAVRLIFEPAGLIRRIAAHLRSLSWAERAKRKACVVGCLGCTRSDQCFK